MIVNDVFIGISLKLSDFESPDTKQVVIHPLLIIRAELLISFTGPALYITSGYRTPDHNRAVGGAVNSYHLRGMALDCEHPHLSLEELAYLAVKAGFTGVIVHKGHVHCDIRPADQKVYRGFKLEE